ncbi:hypothetical protein HDU79_010414 [Rhizoclosmatium sp. JEL0117]|nr:hypothetical protein HDU79_010414 [Rhizoclosmatium sp. JEL0117]
MRAYCAEEPWGLFDSTLYKSRFVVVEGNTEYDPFPDALEDPEQYPDQISLHALYLANKGKWREVMRAVLALIKKTKASYNIVTKRYDYTVRDFYHLCDMKMVMQRLLDRGELAGDDANMLKNGIGAYSSWKTGVKMRDGSLINTETTTLAMLALGAGALWRFEFVEYRMVPCPGFVQFPDTLPHTLCAKLYEIGNVGDGLIAQGPFVRIPVGQYTVCVNTRLNKGFHWTNDNVLTVQVFDGINTLGFKSFGLCELVNEIGEEEWKQIRVPFEVKRVENVIELRRRRSLDSNPQSTTHEASQETQRLLARLLSVQTETLQQMRDQRRQLDTLSEHVRELKAAVAKLPNPTTKFYTRISHLPLDLVVEVFAWMAPQRAMLFRRLSRVFNSFLISKAFAKMSLSRAVPVAAQRQTAPDSFDLSHFDEMLFFLPRSFQNYYVDTYMAHIERINWFRARERLVYIPRAICTHSKNLKVLNLSQCRLKGLIPLEIHQLTILTHLNLSFNSLRGNIPHTIYNMKHLIHLDLSHNELVGTIDERVEYLTMLSHLNLSNNPGSIPNEFGSKEGLVIPVELGTLTSLRELYIANEVIGWLSHSQKRHVLQQLVHLTSSDLDDIPVYYDY